jgi:hypothetical protein
MVIQMLLSQNQPWGDDAITYFYCNQNEPDRQDPTKIMQSIVRQLSLQSPIRGLRKPAVAEYEKRSELGHAAGPLEFCECQDLMAKLLGLYHCTTLVIDGLDESKPGKCRTDFLIALTEIMNTSTSFVKIFISSRDDGDIALRLGNVPNAFIETSTNGGDIERLIQRELGRCIERQTLLRGDVSEDLKAEISTVLLEKAGGM